MNGLLHIVNQFFFLDACEFEIPKRYDPDERRDSNHSNNKIAIQEIDAAIYSNPDIIDDLAVPAPEPPPLGSLMFEVRYEKYEEQLNVHLIGAQRLPVRHLVTEPGVASHGGIIKCDPMVEVCLLPEEKPIVESYTQFGIQDPKFDEHFAFKLSSSELNNKTLRFTVYDHKRRHKLTPIGHVLYSLKGLGKAGALDEKIIERNLKLNSQVKLKATMKSRLSQCCSYCLPLSSLSQSRACAQILANPTSRVAIKSCIPLTSTEYHTVFWSNPESRELPT